MYGRDLTERWSEYLSGTWSTTKDSGFLSAEENTQPPQREILGDGVVRYDSRRGKSHHYRLLPVLRDHDQAQRGAPKVSRLQLERETGFATGSYEFTLSGQCLARRSTRSTSAIIK